MAALACIGCDYESDGTHKLVHFGCPRHGFTWVEPKRRWPKRPRSVTIAAGQAQGTKAARALRREIDAFHLTGRDRDLLEERPRTRGECLGQDRPCPFVSCRHHLYLDVNEESGAIKINFPGLEVWEMTETCSLDVADRGGITLEAVGEMVNLTRERIRQVEADGMTKVKAQTELADLPPAVARMVRESE